MIPVDPNIKDKASYLLFGSLAVAVVALFYDIFTPKKSVEIELVIGIIFTGIQDKVVLNVDNCQYAIYDRNNKGGNKIPLGVRRRGDSWECIVILTSVDESVRLFLEDNKGKIWSTANIGMRLITADAM